ncbi:MAG: hypothetical protein ABIF85_01445 [Nanoarchaeota archaeon]|nr:hypothetical protein [Nanoarchaeota archaeon]MBU4299756.1 hypothetical protein [Nanoarchaeota archaeon]MBU4452570.1 hypothetical protein [Nanoarchaeota archaeon]MCG2723535.1 hypothetical protein [archaeon]
MEKHYGGISHKLVTGLLAIILVQGFFDWIGVSNTVQYVLFIFTYVLIVAYWVRHKHSVKRFPPKNGLGVLIDIIAMFVLFLIMKAASLQIGFYFAALAVLRAVDALGISRMLSEYVLKRAEAHRFNTLRKIYFLEAIIYVLFESLSFNYGLPNVLGITALMLVWLFGRISEHEL